MATKSKVMAESEASHKRQQHRLEKAIKEQSSRLKAVEQQFDHLKANPQVRKCAPISDMRTRVTPNQKD